MQGYLYQCLVTNGLGTVASNTARLTVTGSALPVNFVSVAASQKANAINVEWKTASEVGVDRYEVEKNINGLFTKTASVKAKGGAINEYAWTDASPVEGPNLYRIKSVDGPGETKYSKVVSVRLNTNGAAGLNAYPNPVAGSSVTVQLTGLEKDAYSIRLINAGGQTVMTQILNHAGGSATQIIGLNNDLPKGIYTLQLVGRNTTLTKQLSKQ